MFPRQQPVRAPASMSAAAPERSPAAVVDEPAARPGIAGRGGRSWWELVVVLLAVALVARRPAYMLSHPFWLDEGWVADSVRAPLHQLRLLTSSTPIGWTLLLRLVPPVGGPQQLRLLPLAFGVASVIPAWSLGRMLGGATPVYGLAAALAAAVVPLGLARHDLKQYTAEACLALVLMLAAARLEASWSRCRLAILAAACIFAFPFSNTAPFVTIGLFGGLALATAFRRAWRRLAELTVVTVVVAAAQGAFYVGVASAGDNPVMRAYWSRRFVPSDQGLGVAADFVAARFHATLHDLGLGPWPVAAALVGLGLVALARAGLGGIALAVPLIAVELVVAGVLHRYPVLDQRTSLFVITLWMVLAGLGLAWLAVGLAAGRGGGAVPSVAALETVLVPAARTAAATPLPDADVRGVVRYVLDHREPGDVVVVSVHDSYSFAWYWPDRPVFVRTRAPTAVRFQVTYPPGGPVVARYVDDASLDDALAQVRPGTRRVWLLVAHYRADQRAPWLTRLARLGATARMPMDGLVLARFPTGPR
jgi:hypothetical protein